MKVVVDALPAEFGGIATYVTNLLAGWVATFPDDELHVVVRRDAPPLPESDRVHRHDADVAGPATLGRPISQTRLIPRTASDVGADVVLATMPSTTLRSPGTPVAVVVHDLRHELRPDQFSRSRRLIRRVGYPRAYSLADGLIAVSQRTLDDLLRLHPELADRRSVVIHHGADHVDSWTRQGPHGRAIAHGHHSHKNVDLVVDGWHELVQTGAAVPPVLLVGLGTEASSRISQVVQGLGLAEHVHVSDYLPDPDFQVAMTGARLVVFPSDFEGFGLPVLEAMRLGIPVVVGPDPAVLEIAGGHATIMSDWSPRALSDAVIQALAVDDARLAAASRHAAAFTWRRTAIETRAFLEDLVAARPAR